MAAGKLVEIHNFRTVAPHRVSIQSSPPGRMRIGGHSGYASSRSSGSRVANFAKSHPPAGSSQSPDGRSKTGPRQIGLVAPSPSTRSAIAARGLGRISTATTGPTAAITAID